MPPEATLVYNYTMQSLRRRIAELIPNPDWSFVFPAEVSARHWRHALLTAGLCDVVRADRFLSWDRFKEEAFGLTEARRPVNGTVRTLFAASLAEEQRNAPFLERLLGGGENGGAGELTRILPRLHALVPLVSERSWPLARDLIRLEERYRAFLDSRGLFEPSSLAPTMEGINRSYLLVAPELLEDYPAYRHWIEGNPRIEIFRVPEAPAPRIEIHPDARTEATVLFRRIRGLLAEGVAPDEIVITLPAVDTNRRFLEEAAHRYEVPLLFRTGRSLSEYGGVRLFGLIAEAVGASFEIGTMKNLLLNAAIPWRDRGALRRLVLDGAECYVLRDWRDTDGRHGWEEQLARAGKRESLDLYRRLKGGMHGLVRAADFASAVTAVQAFVGTFLDTDRWQGEEAAQLRAFQRALEILNDFARTESEFPELAAGSPFALWTAALNEAGYVEQRQDEGIQVYPYRVSALLSPRYHFIPFLTQVAGSVLWDRGFPLNEAQREEIGIEDVEAGDAYLIAYLASGDTVTASFAEQGFGGPGLPPGLFVEQGGVVRPEGGLDVDDPERLDREFFSGRGDPPAVPAAWQRRGFAAFAATGGLPVSADLLETPIADPELAGVIRQSYPDGPDCDGISATALDAFAACPFAYLFQYPLALEETDYSPQVRDHRLEGILLHKVLEKFIAALPGGRFQASETDAYREDIRRILRDTVAGRRGPLPVGPAWEASAAGLEEQLALFPEVEGTYFDGYRSAASEKSVTCNMDGISLTGRIDRVSRGPGGELLVVDYKKSLRHTAGDLNGREREPATFQLPFYVLLLEGSGLCTPGDELIAAYYIASEGKYAFLHSAVEFKGARPAAREEEFDELLRRTREKIVAMRRRIDAGDYSSQSEECACPLRALCRERYVLRREKE